MRHFTINWVLGLVLLAICVPTGGYAMIQTLPLEQLVGGSDLVVVAMLKSSRDLQKDSAGFLRVEKVVTIDKVLKGSATSGKDLTFETIADFEDSPKIPKGCKVVLFLKANEAGVYEVVNLVQGAWPLLENGKCSGMGLGQTLNSLIELIKKNPQAAPVEEVFEPEF